MGQGIYFTRLQYLQATNYNQTSIFISLSKLRVFRKRSDENRVSQNSNFNQNQYLYQYSKVYCVQISVTRVQFQVRAMKMKGVPNFEKTSTFIQIFALTLFRNYEVSRMKRVSQLSNINFENSSISKIHRALCLGEERNSISRFKVMNVMTKRVTKPTNIFQYLTKFAPNLILEQRHAKRVTKHRVKYFRPNFDFQPFSSYEI